MPHSAFVRNKNFSTKRICAPIHCQRRKTTTVIMKEVLIIVMLLSFSWRASSHDVPKNDDAVVFLPEDLTALTLYGDGAMYAPSLCPSNITFTARARILPGFSELRLGIFATDIEANGYKCKSIQSNFSFDFFPIGQQPVHYPAQWLFERSTGRRSTPIDLICGTTSFSIRYGYFNDVKVDTTTEQLDASVVYFDFAVVPTSTPFSFCSYATRRSDGNKPIDYVPFPSHDTWDVIKKKRGYSDDDAMSTPQPTSSSIEDMASPVPNDSTESSTTDEERFGLNTIRSFFFGVLSN